MWNNKQLKILLVIISTLIVVGCSYTETTRESIQEELPREPQKIINEDTETKEPPLEELQIEETETQPTKSILSQTHKVDHISRQGDITWAGIKTTPSNDLLSYELWLFNKDKKYLVDHFTHNQCGSVDWTVSDNNNVKVQFIESPCVDLAKTTYIIYQTDRKIIAKTEQESHHNYKFNFRNRYTSNYEIETTVNGVCEGFQDHKDHPSTAPEIEMTGVKITNTFNEEEFVYELPEPIQTRCNVVHSDRFIVNPALEIISVNEKDIEFKFLDNYTAIIPLDYKIEPTVIFN